MHAILTLEVLHAHEVDYADGDLANAANLFRLIFPAFCELVTETDWYRAVDTATRIWLHELYDGVWRTWLRCIKAARLLLLLLLLFMPRYSVHGDLEEISNKEQKNYNGCNWQWTCFEMRPRSLFAVLWTSAGTGRRSLSRRLWCLLSVFRSPWPVRRLDGD